MESIIPNVGMWVWGGDDEWNPTSPRVGVEVGVGLGDRHPDSVTPWP